MMGWVAMALEKFSGLAVAGEDIEAGDTVVMAMGSNLLFSANLGPAGWYVGKAVERIREGFRVRIEHSEVKEDDT